MEGFRLIIVTGMSGAGKTQVMQVLEDMGYFCIDNIPPVLIPKFSEICRQTGGTKVSQIALVVDIRSREFFDDFVRVLGELDAGGVPYELLFIEASDDVIIRRHYDAPGADAQMSVNILSFGFKYGIPLDADLVFDVRFLPNPFYIDSLRSKSGTVPQVASYIESWDVTQKFEEHLDNFVDFLLPQYVKERKSQLVIAVGCTGGMHRSVFIAKHLYDRIKKHYAARLEHRDLMKNEVQEHVSEG